ncbi:MAG: hypothetical protein HY298_01410 [Verrucomicrobia bacterium]|nr:hypothetical protein [Verrucomicrobiota bacterium]
MTLDEAIKSIKDCASRMNDVYEGVVFDEWTIVQLAVKKGKILSYTGPRKEDFQKNFLSDVEALRSELMSLKHGCGDFEFARHGGGTRFDAFMVLGDGMFLICNHTGQSMNEITKNTRWLSAQVPFVDLSEKFRSNPVKLPT